MTRYFFSGISGSGMFPLALIAQARGYKVAGSDRSFDQGRFLDKRAFLEQHVIPIYPQDGGGIAPADTLVISTAVEDMVPDVVAAKANGCPIIKRAELLAEFFNATPRRVAVAGTSGKSTTTGMLAFITATCGLAPTVMNGGIMKNFITADYPYASAVVGAGDIFISECDESDGSIALYRPSVAILNNIALDHKDMPTLRRLFGDFLHAADHCVVNADCAESLAIAPQNALLFSASSHPKANLVFENGHVHDRAAGQHAALNLIVPGQHNISNALGAIAAAIALGIALPDACAALAKFTGIKRRMDVIGTTTGAITVIDDFGHNPDKIAATLRTLRERPGRLLVLFQMHGFGMLKLLSHGLVDTFAAHLTPDDRLYLPEALYFGGTIDKTLTMQAIADALSNKGLNVRFYTNRDAAMPDILHDAKQEDRILVMGARDDGLSDYAQKIFASISSAA